MHDWVGDVQEKDRMCRWLWALGRLGHALFRVYEPDLAPDRIWQPMSALSTLLHQRQAKY